VITADAISVNWSTPAGQTVHARHAEYVNSRRAVATALEVYVLASDAEATDRHVDLTAAIAVARIDHGRYLDSLRRNAQALRASSR